MSTDTEIRRDLETAFPAPSAAELEALVTRLAARADDAGVLDLAYRTVDSPVGPLLLASSPVGLVRVAFAREHHDTVLAELASAIGPRILRAPSRTEEVARQLDEYFAGRRHQFDVPVDLQLVHGFRFAVISHLREIAYGATETYAAVARAAGSPAAVRAVGTACGHNPVPIVVPCHRVVRADGSIGQYRGGAEAKATLLALESAT